MKVGRNLPRGRANQENQEELERMERRNLGTNTPAGSGNPWDILSQKANQPTTRGIKNYIHIDWLYLVVLLVIAAAVVLFALLNPAAAEALPAFAPGEPHLSTPEYTLYFETVSASNGVTTISVQQKIYDEAQASALQQSVADDLAALYCCASISPSEFIPHTVYIVERPVNGSIERQGNHVYCTAADIQSGAYRPLLYCAALGTEEYWIGAGLAELVLGAVPDDALLRKYFTDTDSLDLLSLSVPFFISDFASSVEITLARQTALSLCRFALTPSGVSALLHGDPTILRQEWLYHLGINRIYEDTAPELLSQYRFRAASQYSFIAVDPYQNTIYMKPMPDMLTAHDAHRFLADMLSASHTLFDLLASDAPEYAASVQNRFIKLRTYCGNDSGSYSIPEYREVRLALAAGWFHEVGHILFPTVGGANFYTTMWQYEGLCNYLANDVYAFDAWQRQLFDALTLFSAMDEPQTVNHRFMKRAVALYLKQDALPASASQVNVPLYRHAMALVPVLYPDDADRSDWAASVQAFYPALQSKNGNELTHEQAYSFTGWLIDQYSLSAFLDFCMQPQSFDEAFGISYETALAAWLDWLSVKFQ